jgi:hypothetical protein
MKRPLLASTRSAAPAAAVRRMSSPAGLALERFEPLLRPPPPPGCSFRARKRASPSSGVRRSPRTISERAGRECSYSTQPVAGDACTKGGATSGSSQRRAGGCDSSIATAPLGSRGWLPARSDIPSAPAAATLSVGIAAVYGRVDSGRTTAPGRAHGSRGGVDLPPFTNPHRRR